MGQPGLLKLQEVIHAVRQRRVGMWSRAVVGERGILAAIGRGHRRVVDAEIAHVHLVDDDIFRCGQRRLAEAVPAGRFQVAVVQIDELAAHIAGRCAVLRQADRIRVAYQIVLHRIGGRHIDLDVEEVELAVPRAVAGHTPDAGGGVEGHGVAAHLRAGRGGVAFQRYRLGRRRPDLDRRRAGAVANAQRGVPGRAVVHVQVVQHTLDLCARRIQPSTAAVVAGDNQLAGQKELGVVRRQAGQQSGQPGRVGVLGVTTDCAAGGQVHVARAAGRGERASHRFGCVCHFPVGIVEQLVARAAGPVPCDGVRVQPEGFGGDRSEGTGRRCDGKRGAVVGPAVAVIHGGWRIDAVGAGFEIDFKGVVALTEGAEEVNPRAGLCPSLIARVRQVFGKRQVHGGEST